MIFNDRKLIILTGRILNALSEEWPGIDPDDFVEAFILKLYKETTLEITCIPLYGFDRMAYELYQDIQRIGSGRIRFPAEAKRIVKVQANERKIFIFWE